MGGVGTVPAAGSVRACTCRRPAAHRSKRDGWAAAGSAASRVPAGWPAAVPPGLGAPGLAIARLLPVWRATAGLAVCPPGWGSALAGQRPANGAHPSHHRQRWRLQLLSARERPRARRTRRAGLAAPRSEPRAGSARSECALARSRQGACLPPARRPTSFSQGASDRGACDPWRAGRPTSSAWPWARPVP